MFPQLFTMSWRPTGMGWMPTTGDDQHSGSPPIPTGMTHRESRQTDSSSEGEHSGSPPIPTGMTHRESRQTDSSSEGEEAQSLTWTYKPIKQMNITMFLMLFHNLMKDKMYKPRLQECLEKTPSAEIAWETLRANLTLMARMEASILLMVAGRAMLAASAEELEKLPVPKDIALIKAVMNQFNNIHCNLTKEARRAVYHWLKRALKSVMCPERERPQGDREDRRDQDTPTTGLCNWVNETTLGIVHLYVFEATPSDLKLITEQQTCRMFTNPQFAIALSVAYDMETWMGKQLFHTITTSCINVTAPNHITRLGALACFFEDVESLDNITSNALLKQLMACPNANARQNIKRLVKDTPLTGDLLQTVGQALSVFSAQKLDKISGQDIRENIEVFATVEDFQITQSRLLVSKFILAGGKLNSSSDLLGLGHLIAGVCSTQLRNMPSEELAKVAKGFQEEQANKLIPFQKTTIVLTILENEDTTAVFWSLSSSFRKELPTSSIGKANITDLAQVKDTEWNKGQALFICEGLLTKNAIPVDELGQLGSLVAGVTCEMFERSAGSAVLNMCRSLGNVTAWLSRAQLVCVAKLLGSALDAYDPQALQDNVDTILTNVSSEILLHLSEQYICQTLASSCTLYLKTMAEARFELLPRSSAIRECVRVAAIRCLDKSVSELEEADLAFLGRVVCEFSGNNVSELQDAAFGASIPQFGKCPQFHATAPTLLADRITSSLGNASMWTSEMVASLGPMVSFLDKDTLQQIPNTVDLSQVLLKLQALQGPAASSEFQTGFSLTVITVTVFNRLVQPTAEGNTQRRRRAASCKVTPSSDKIHELGQANSLWSAEQLSCISTETFSDSIGVLGSVLGFSPEQRSVLTDKAIEAWGAPATFSQSEIASLQYLLSALSVSDLETMDLSSLDNLDSVAGCPSWTQDQRRAVLERYLELNGLTAARLNAVELSGLGNFLCAMNASQINALQGDAIKLAAAGLGKLTCPSKTLDLLKEKCSTVFGGMSTWNDSQLTELGTIVGAVCGAAEGAGPGERWRCDPGADGPADPGAEGRCARSTRSLHSESAALRHVPQPQPGRLWAGAHGCYPALGCAAVWVRCDAEGGRISNRPSHPPAAAPCTRLRPHNVFPHPSPAWKESARFENRFPLKSELKMNIFSK
ncbi:otoancorin-like isoform X2 [Hemiscyllium ocellatum]|uniref:otoancorin-like isoform X2 n=1 Tax=Hemiscyllium ocellatum TaxID=170820 RepID=UPI002966F843|nr:otoancorin-like isoform X2 [Hemiscyllium ocellatum]